MSGAKTIGVPGAVFTVSGDVVSGRSDTAVAHPPADSAHAPPSSAMIAHRTPPLVICRRRNILRKLTLRAGIGIGGIPSPIVGVPEAVRRVGRIYPPFGHRRASRPTRGRL